MAKVEILTGAERQRRWSTELKLSILQEAFSADGSVSDAASSPDSAFDVWPGTAIVAGVSAQNGVNPAIAVGRHIGDDRFDLIHQALISKRRSPTG